MRTPAYISPSSLGLWESNREEFYLRHLAECRLSSIPQANYMSIGSAFDAYVKSTMFEELFGKTDPRFEFETLFEEQVESHNRDWAKKHGGYVFASYVASGAYADLMDMLKTTKQAPQFEFRITGAVEEVPLLGKPDLRFIHPDGAHVILDWKVNGYCSKSATSPCKYFRCCRDGWPESYFKPSRGNGKSHPEYKPIMWKGIEIHNGWLEDANQDWSDQLTIYAWMLGEPVGTQDVVVCIDQIVAKPHPNGSNPLLRVANHRARISLIHQQNLLARLKNCWESITSNYIFPDLTKDESEARCAMLEQQAEAASSGDEMQQWINDLARAAKTY